MTNIVLAFVMDAPLPSPAIAAAAGIVGFLGYGISLPKGSPCWECHIEPDWLLIWYQTEEELVLAASGTHSDLFG